MHDETTLPIASRIRRIFSFIIDDLVIMFLLIAIFYEPLMAIVSHIPAVLTPEAVENFKEEMQHFSADNLLIVLSLKVVYHTIFVWQNGMTLGKYLTKIRVVDLDTNTKPTFLKAFFRAVLRLGSEIIFYLGFLLAFFLPLKQTFHDKVSHCVVIDV